MRYSVRGANRETGESISVSIDAKSATEAERQAQALGILVTDVEVDMSALQVAVPPIARPADAPAPVGPDAIICPNPQCGYRGRAKKEARGSCLLAVLLLFLFFVPGLLYLIFMSGYNYCCPRCGMLIRPGKHS